MLTLKAVLQKAALACLWLFLAVGLQANASDLPENRYTTPAANTDGNFKEIPVSTSGEKLKPRLHPILEVRPHEEDVLINLEDDTFRKMINLEIPKGSEGYWEDAFEPAEREAASKLCKKLRGLTERQIAKMLGAPSYRAGSPLCFEKQPDKDNWLYFFGGTPELLRIEFSHGQCEHSSVLNYDQDNLYNNWRAADLGRYAIGKTQSQIIAYAGLPQSRSSKAVIQQQSVYYQNSLIPEAAWKSADEIMHFQFGYPISAGPVSGLEDLFIKDGRCTYATPRSACISIMAGFKFQPSNRNLNAKTIFRRPGKSKQK